MVNGEGAIIGFGDVSPESYHPESQTVNVNGIFYIYPIDKNGVERKWRYARQSVDAIASMLRARKTSKGYEIEIGKTFGVVKTVWNERKYDANEYGTRLVSDLVPHNGFTFPKSLWTVHDSLYAGTKDDKDSIILDLFSGSATTAHAVMQLNAEDGGHRKFIMVQLPEKTDEKSEAHKAGYKNICEIGEERIRRAGAKIKGENPLTASELDIGFRVFRVDSTNMEDVYYRPADIKQEQLRFFTDNIKPDRTPEDLLFQVMLDLGILLSSEIEETEIAGKKVFIVGGKYDTLDGETRTHLIACFDSDVTGDIVTEIAKLHPNYAVFRDSGMANDAVMTNFEQIFESYSPKTQRKVL